MARLKQMTKRKKIEGKEKRKRVSAEISLTHHALLERLKKETGVKSNSELLELLIEEGSEIVFGKDWKKIMSEREEGDIEPAKEKSIGGDENVDG